MARLIIRDGMTRNGVFPGDHGLPAVKFRYRPCRPGRYMEYQREIRDADRKEIINHVAKFVSEHVVEWDIDDPDKPDGAAKAEISDANVKGIPHLVLFHFIDAIASLPSALQYETEKN